jgi:hypothetical protein
VLVSSESLNKQIEALRWTSLVAAVGLFLALLFLWKSGGDPIPGSKRYQILLTLYGLDSWCFVLAFLGLGRRLLNFSNSFLTYSNEGVLPFYVLHQTIILTVGYFVLRWTIADSLKFLIISAASFPLIAGLYEFGIRRTNVTRFLFGMKKLVSNSTLLRQTC